MTATWAAFIVLSLVGAAAFFAAGLILARQRAAAAPEVVAPEPAIPEPALPAGATPAPATLGAAGPEELLRRLRADRGVHTAVVSDELGLLVAGGGERAEELAALGGFLAGVGDRARQLGGLGTPTRVVIEDDRHTTLTASHVPGAPLVAVTVRRDQVTPAGSGARPAATRR